MREKLETSDNRREGYVTGKGILSRVYPFVVGAVERKGGGDGVRVKCCSHEMMSADVYI